MEVLDMERENVEGSFQNFAEAYDVLVLNT